MKNIDFTKYINYLIILYAFSLPVSRAGITFFSILLIVLWLFQGNFKDQYLKIKNSRIIISLMLFIAFGYLSLFWTTPLYYLEGLSDVTKTVRLALLPLIVIATSLKTKYIPYILSAFLFGMFISEVMSYGIYFEVWTYGHATPNDPTPFMNHLDYSTFLAFTSLLLLNKFYTTYVWKEKIFYAIYFLFVTSNLFLNGGRTGQVAFIISILFLIFLNIKNKALALLSMLFMTSSILYLAYNISPIFKDRLDLAAVELQYIQHSTPNQYLGSVGQRIGLWILSAKIIEDNPLLGIGAGSVETIIKSYKENAPKDFHLIGVNSTHNVYLELFITYGLIGLVFYLFIWYFVFKLPIKNNSLSNLKIVFVSVYSIGSIFEILFFNQFSLSLFTLFIGIFIAINLSESTEGIEYAKTKN